MSKSQEKRKTVQRAVNWQDQQRATKASSAKKMAFQHIDHLVDVVAPRVGDTPEKRLSWALKLVNDPPPATPGDWTNLQLEIAVFTYNLQADPSGPYIPSEAEAQQIVDEFRTILKKVLRGETIDCGSQHFSLKFNQSSQRWWSSSELKDGWLEEAKDQLFNLIHQAGHLVKECKAPAPRSEAACGKLFVATRNDRVYCSTRCTSRAATNAWRIKRN
jgi:hypothetical protein